MIEVKQTKTTVTGRVIGLVIPADSVSSLYPGRVVYIGYDGTSYTINVRTNVNEVLRYGNIDSVLIRVGDDVMAGQEIGIVKESYLLEYATTWRAESECPVRIADVTYYKQDPTEIVSGMYDLRQEASVDYKATSGIPRVAYTTSYAQEEFKRK